MKLIATVVNIGSIEMDPGVNLPTGTRLFLDEPFVPLGDPLGGGFFAGEMILDGIRYALIVAPKAAGESSSLRYKREDYVIADGAVSDNDGLANSELINDPNHPAAQFCRPLKIGGFDDWYLPSRDELAMLWRNLGPCRKDTPETFREGGEEAFDQDWYWSSTQSASYSYCAWYLNFFDGTQTNAHKFSNFGVRAVRRLKI